MNTTLFRNLSIPSFARITYHHTRQEYTSFGKSILSRTPAAKQTVVSNELTRQLCTSQKRQFCTPQKRPLCTLQKRQLFTSQKHQCTGKLAVLPTRGLIEISGRDSAKLLQGLITNDMDSLLSTGNNGESDGTCVIHSHVLNVQGRIMFDIFIYSTPEENNFLLECDRNEAENLIAYLKRYKLRSKVKFEERSDLNVLALFQEQPDIPWDEKHFKTTAIDNVLALIPDPRLNTIGFRCVATADEPSVLDNVSKILRNSNDDGNALETVDEHCYHRHRYELGIAEGCEEAANGIPLEYNAALLNGVSFQKGCYIGQELVARANFTGVIRKRVMPLKIANGVTAENLNVANSVNRDLVPNGSTIYTAKRKRAGKVLAVNGEGYGIGLMRLKECLPENESDEHVELFVQSTADSEQKINVKVNRPTWWPCDLE